MKKRMDIMPEELQIWKRSLQQSAPGWQAQGWAQAACADIAMNLVVKLEQAWVVEQETYRISLSLAQALVLRQALLENYHHHTAEPYITMLCRKCIAELDQSMQ